LVGLNFMKLILNITYIYCISLLFASTVYILFLSQFIKLDNLNIFSIILTTGILLIPNKFFDKWKH